MTETNTNTNTNTVPEKPTGPNFRIQRIYLKKSSLDASNSVRVAQEPVRPTMDVQIGVNVEPVNDNLVEVVVLFHVKAQADELTICECHIEQAGRFEVHGFDAQQRMQFERAVCPQIMFPYVRFNLNDMFTRAGLPPVQLDEINFHALLQQQLEQQEADKNPARMKNGA